MLKMSENSCLTKSRRIKYTTFRKQQLLSRKREENSTNKEYEAPKVNSYMNTRSVTRKMFNVGAIYHPSDISDQMEWKEWPSSGMHERPVFQPVTDSNLKYGSVSNENTLEEYKTIRNVNSKRTEERKTISKILKPISCKSSTIFKSFKICMHYSLHYVLAYCAQVMSSPMYKTKVEMKYSNLKKKSETITRANDYEKDTNKAKSNRCVKKNDSCENNYKNGSNVYDNFKIGKHTGRTDGLNRGYCIQYLFNHSSKSCNTSELMNDMSDKIVTIKKTKESNVLSHSLLATAANEEENELYKNLSYSNLNPICTYPSNNQTFLADHTKASHQQQDLYFINSPSKMQISTNFESINDINRKNITMKRAKKSKNLPHTVLAISSAEKNFYRNTSHTNFGPIYTYRLKNEMSFAFHSNAPAEQHKLSHTNLQYKMQTPRMRNSFDHISYDNVNKNLKNTNEFMNHIPNDIVKNDQTNNVIDSMNTKINKISLEEAVNVNAELTDGSDNYQWLHELLENTSILYCAANGVHQDDLANYINSLNAKDCIDWLEMCDI